MTDDPVTGTDVRDLSTNTSKLTSEFRKLSDRQDATEKTVGEKADAAAVASTDRKATRANIIAGVAVVAVLGAGLSTWANRQQAHRLDSQQRRLDAQQQESETDRAQRTVGSCIQFNVNQQNVRAGIVQGVVGGFRPFIAAGSEDRLVQFEAALQASVEGVLPFRDCSPSGIEQFLKDPPADPAVN